MHRGTVTAILLDKGFGFISEPNQPDLFFHASDLAAELEFDEQLQERRVRFDVVATAKGLRAKNIQATD